MNLVVIKFGGSSLDGNTKLIQSAKKAISFLNDYEKVVVIVSAQGNTTDKLLKEAKELNSQPDKRELDMLLSTGEQVACSKFTIALQSMGYKATSLTGWQAGILTDSNYTQAKIQNIYTDRIWELLETNQIVVIAGFQGIDVNKDITTLGRDGSDTTAVSISAALNQDKCYIFTDVNGIYDKDPHKYKNAKKIEQISYEDMTKLVENGAKVLHGRCIKIAQKYGIEIIVNSTNGNDGGSCVKGTIK